MVEVNFAWAVVAFLVGLYVTRRNMRFQHAATVRAAQAERFDLLQRDTWVALQDALGDLLNASRDSVDAEESVETTLLPDRSTGPDTAGREVEADQASSGHVAARQRAVALSSRLADEWVRLVVDGAIETIRAMGSPSGRDPQRLWRQAAEATEAAIELLGGLIRTPPGPQPDRLWFLGGRGLGDTVDPGTAHP